LSTCELACVSAMFRRSGAAFAYLLVVVVEGFGIFLLMKGVVTP
jgi:hypothetical protein